MVAVMMVVVVVVTFVVIEVEANSESILSYYLRKRKNIVDVDFHRRTIPTLLLNPSVVYVMLALPLSLRNIPISPLSMGSSDSG